MLPQRDNHHAAPLPLSSAHASILRSITACRAALTSVMRAKGSMKATRSPSKVVNEAASLAERLAVSPSIEMPRGWLAAHHAELAPIPRHHRGRVERFRGTNARNSGLSIANRERTISKILEPARKGSYRSSNKTGGAPDRGPARTRTRPRFLPPHQARVEKDESPPWDVRGRSSRCWSARRGRERPRSSAHSRARKFSERETLAPRRPGEAHLQYRPGNAPRGPYGSAVTCITQPLR